MRRASLVPYCFLIPALVLIGIFIVYPLVYTIYASLFYWKGRTMGDFIGLGNYLNVLGRRRILDLSRSLFEGPPLGALTHNALWVVIHVPLCTILGLLLALLLRDVKGASIIKTIIFLAMVIPLVVGGIILRFIYDVDAGVVNAILGATGLVKPKTWTVLPDTALFSLIFGSVWLWTGFSMTIYAAGLEAIPKELYEAAKIDGASGAKIFWHITIPLLKPATITVVVMSVLWVLKVFDIIYVVTMGGPGGASTVLALEMYIEAFY
ncbi:TPA: sugar ABC transporter permease, partial [Candidatus Bathyarchaeota archaeon]|nr:sugar ABC transporter permease [Candidatus Bathyarchaeota archaeon]